jgi:hypothetical protein
MWTDLTPLLAASSADAIFGSMPPDKRAIGDQIIDLFRRQAGQQVAGFVEYARRVGQQDQFFRFQNFGQLARDHVGIDVVGLAFAADADRRDDRDEIAGIEKRDQAGVDLGDFADLADVDDIAGNVVDSIINFLARMKRPSLPVRPTALPPA